MIYVICHVICLSALVSLQMSHALDDAQLASLSSDNVISRQLVNVLDTLHLHTSSHITASSRITAHRHALPHRHSHRTHRTLTDAHIQKHTGYLELPLNYIEPTSS